MVKIELERCDGCGDCAEQCPMSVFQMVDGKAKALKEDKCTVCRLCETVCPQLAITVIE